MCENRHTFARHSVITEDVMAGNGALITIKGSMGETTHKHHTPTNDQTLH